MKKTILWIVGGIVAIGGGYLAYRRFWMPRIDIQSVDWKNKTVKYEMKAGKGFSAGTAALGDVHVTAGKGGYVFKVGSTKKPESIVLTIEKNGKTILQKNVWLESKRVN